MSAPHWPALMLRATAAAYLDMSEGSFLKEIAAGRMPGSIKAGGREHWSKTSLDAAIANLTGVADDVPEYLREFLERHGKAA